MEDLKLNLIFPRQYCGEPVHSIEFSDNDEWINIRYLIDSSETRKTRAISRTVIYQVPNLRDPAVIQIDINTTPERMPFLLNQLNELEAFAKKKSYDLFMINMRYRFSEYIPKGYKPPALKKYNPATNRQIGGDIFFNPNTPDMKYVPSRSLGYKKYSFGVEIETSSGCISPDSCDQLGLSVCSDGSTDGYEYVSKPMHGQYGIRKLRNIVREYLDNCMFNDKCSMHIHIGGNHIDSPKMNRQFSYWAIRLGLQIERELFSIMNPARNEDKPHILSLRHKEILFDGKKIGGSLEGISLNNYRHILAKMTFGVEYFDADYNSKTPPRHKWIPGRYRWLNLIHANSKGPHKTIEFRIFGVPMEEDLAVAYVAFCMAFVWFSENRRRAIMNGGVTIRDIMTQAIKCRSVAENYLNLFESRKIYYSRYR